MFKVLPFKKQLKTSEDVRKALEASKKRRIKENVWELLVLDRYDQDVINGEEGAWKDLVDRHDSLDSIVEDSPTKKEKPKEIKKEIPPDKRLLTLSRINAIEASRLPGVAAFRKEVLGGQLLDPEDVKEWIEKQAEEDGTATKWIEIKAPLPPGVTAEDGSINQLPELIAKVKDRCSVGFSVDALSYPVSGDEWAHRVPVNKDGVLGRLKEVNSTLTRVFSWHEGQATAFILCGLIPVIPKGKGLLSRSAVRSPQTSINPDPLLLPNPPRIHLDLDPRLSSQEVAKFYSSLRQKVFQGRDRDMGDKHLELAVFLAEYPTGRTWKELMDIWNQEKEEEWAYNDWRWFSRDAAAAWERVTGNEWVHRPKNKGGRN